MKKNEKRLKLCEIKINDLSDPQAWFTAIKNDALLLAYIPKKFLTVELCNAALKQNILAFQFIPEHFLSENLCIKVIRKNLTLLKYLPNKYKINTVYEGIFKGSKNFLKKIPKECMTEELCLYALEVNWKNVRNIPQALFTKRIIECCLKKNIVSVNYFPTALKTKEIYLSVLATLKFSPSFKEWLQNDKNNFDYFNNADNNDSQNEYDHFKNFKSIKFPKNIRKDIDIAEKERSLGLLVYNYSFYDDQKKRFVVIENFLKEPQEQYFTKFNDYYIYLNKNLENADLTKYNFKNINISKYNIDLAHLSSQILISLGKYNDTFYNNTIKNFSEEVLITVPFDNETIEQNLSLDEQFYEENNETQKIYYISDLHLNHRLLRKFPQHATEFEIRSYIKKIIFTMIEGIPPLSLYQDHLLIGGDISFCFDISRIFYEELAKVWTPNHIVSILGNHEFWDFNRWGILQDREKNIEDIVSRYRNLFSSLNINFLHNSLYAKIYHNHQYISGTATQEDLLHASHEEIRNFLKNSNLIIWGGIGFSGYNPNFNATHGIYRHTIKTLQDDLYNTKKFEQVYKKILLSLPKDKVIIFTHMPKEDWTIEKHHPNWIYVNGHTHRNYYEENNIRTIYADNQIGYTSTNYCLKYFNLSKYYDLFKYFKDGKYPITREEYIYFNFGMGIRLSYKKDRGQIIMLKRENIYCFLLQKNNTLYLLEGGKIKKLKDTHIDYYYENMLQYSLAIKKLLKNYNTILKQISYDIKKVGGEGKIHGCIVDIDFFNHIYLNPFDGKLIPYYSPMFGAQKTYSNIPELLSEQCPTLYKNYQLLNSTDKNKSLLFLYDETLSSCRDFFVYNTDIYNPSRVIKNLQYLTENNIIRNWNDETLNSINSIINTNTTVIAPK